MALLRIGSLAPFLLLPARAFAQGVGPIQQGFIRAGIPGCDFVTGNLSAVCIPNFIGHAIQIIFSLVGLFCLLNIMFAGYQIALGSLGDKEAGKNRLKWALIGFTVAACAFVIVDAALDVIV